MGLLWPALLLLLGLIPLLVLAYLWMLRRRRRFTVRYSSLALVREALPHYSRLRRHLPFALFLLALGSLVVAVARPVSTVDVPSGRATIILAIDVSRSMCSTDVPPNRLVAAREASQSFIQRQPSSTQIGIVAFAGFAALIQPPTTDQELLQDAIEGLETARRTAIGSAILQSLDAIAEINPEVAPVSGDAASGAQSAPVEAGTHRPDIIVLLTDGASNSGPPPLEAAQEAVDRGIRVYTIGFGTENGSEMDCGALDPNSGRLGFEPQFGGGNSFWGGYRRGIDEVTLKQIAEMTGANYYSASSAGELQQVFQDLPSTLITRQETLEISFAFAAVGAFLAALAIVLSLLWHPLP
jgi:Ca-activated chloride channel family protein